MEEKIAMARARIKELELLIKYWEKQKWIVGIVKPNWFGAAILIANI